MNLDTSGANQVICDAIEAIGNGCSYEELRCRAILLISVGSYLVGYIESMNGEADDE